MKVGIISMQRVPNYGSFLQAYALKSMIEELGHTVEFVDYKSKAPIVPYSKKDKLIYELKDISFFSFINDFFKYYILKRKNFRYEYRLKYLKQLNIGYLKKYSKKIDIAVIGSDEVFNCLQSGFNVGFSPMLFGQNINTSKVISYAGSFGYTDIDGIKKYHLFTKLKEYMSTFSSISVRDNNSKKIVKEILGIEPNLNLDPVLMYDFKLPDENVEYDNYVLLYTYKSRKYSQEEKEQILHFCKKNKKTLVSVGNAQEWIPNKILVSPLHLLNYVKNADFIITDTFHGTVFSIKYNKNFATLIRPDNLKKLYDLLERLDQTERIINNFQQLQEMYLNCPNYSNTNKIIFEEKEKTRNYLDINLKNKEKK